MTLNNNNENHVKTKKTTKNFPFDCIRRISSVLIHFENNVKCEEINKCIANIDCVVRIHSIEEKKISLIKL